MEASLGQIVILADGKLEQGTRNRGHAEGSVSAE
jgi:hypothetical protein